jgi:hypothetical protein
LTELLGGLLEHFGGVAVLHDGDEGEEGEEVFLKGEVGVDFPEVDDSVVLAGLEAEEVGLVVGGDREAMVVVGVRVVAFCRS